MTTMKIAADYYVRTAHAHSVATQLAADVNNDTRGRLHALVAANQTHTHYPVLSTHLL